MMSSSASSPVRLALVEDHPGLRDRVVQQLAYFDAVDLDLVSESGEAFLADLEVRDRSGQPLPQVVLMDIEVPGPDGIETTRQLSTLWPSIDVLMLTVFEDEDRIFRAIQAGASGYLLKDAGPERIVQAVLEVVDGGAPTSPLVARKLLGYVKQQAAPHVMPFSLTKREQDVLSHLIEDATEKRIAEQLGVSPHTIRTHVKNLYRKLQVHSRAQAVRVAIEQGLTR
ncbi:MAG: response regulator transcription factor [Bacteroidota bacterium]